MQIWQKCDRQRVSSRQTFCDLQTLLHPFFLDFLGHIQRNYYNILDRIIAFCMIMKIYRGKPGVGTFFVKPDLRQNQLLCKHYFLEY